MNRLIFVLLIFLLTSQAQALDTLMRGFLSFDTLSYLKYKDRSVKTGATQSESITSGLGVLLLSAYTRHKNFSGKIKVDLDANLSYKYAFFEEAYLRYNFSKLLSITVGKGKLPFHRNHWGAIKHTFRDGGSVLNTNLFFRDQDRKLMTSLRYGSYYAGFFHYFTVWMNPEEYRYDYDDKTYVQNESKQGDFAQQKGLAYKFEYLNIKNIQFSVAGLWYKHDLYNYPIWATTIGAKYHIPELELWWESTYGFSHTYPQTRYATYKKYEQVHQFGAEYNLTWLLGLLVAFEVAQVNENEYDIAGDDYQNGESTETDNYKYELALKFKFSRSFYASGGAYIEEKRERKSKDGTFSGGRNRVFGFSSGFSLWF